MDGLKTRVTKLSRDRNLWIGLRLVGVVCILLLILIPFLLSQKAAPLKSWTHKHTVADAEDRHQKHMKKPKGTIPNLVHFVFLVDDPSELSIPFSLRRFVAIYSAHYYLKPEVIYIHTNLDQDVIDNIWETCDDRYLQAVGQIPNVEFNRYLAPNMTSTNKKIDKLPNQSDFVRTDVLRKFGGVYLDDDVYILRDLQHLRHLGFEIVTGRQMNGQLCPAVLLSTPENAIITAYHALQDLIFDGGWATHATDLLTALVYDFAQLESTSLVLPVDSFFPGSWEKSDLDWVYRQHEEDAEQLNSRHINPSVHNLTDFISEFELEAQLADPKGKHSETRWHDWRLSYTLHGWTSGIRNAYDEDGKKELFSPYGDITLPYILSRKSNFARAVYPAVKNALGAGLLCDDQVLESPVHNRTSCMSKLADDCKAKFKSKAKENNGGDR